MTHEQISVLLIAIGLAIAIGGLFIAVKAVWIKFYSGWLNAYSSSGSVKFASETAKAVVSMIIGVGLLWAANQLVGIVGGITLLLILVVIILILIFKPEWRKDFEPNRLS